MVQCKYLLLLIGLTPACIDIVVGEKDGGTETTSTDSTSSETTSSTSSSLPGNNVCIGVPYSHPDGEGFETWVKSDCTGDFASVGLSNGFPCVQWPSGDTYCVDFNQPVDKIYFHNPNNNGACEEWTESTWPWYTWVFCGNKPLP